MNNEEIRKKKEIKSALAAIHGDDFLQTSKNLLAVLGYRSERTTKLPGTAEDFIQRFPARNENTETEQEFLNNAESVKLVFQVRSEEIAPSDQPTLFESPAFDKGYVRSFIFFAIELKDPDYPRGKYAQFTREVNKRFIMPIVVFFRVENHLTIGFVGRRQDKRDPDRDVLEQVTLIKDIRLDNPHRAHLDILFELSLGECVKWMTSEKQPENFDGLLAAWLARLDTEELNKKFYRELFAWFEWAVVEGKFPTDKNHTLKPEEHIIRLITRLLFVWFIKEKGLVADELFNETHVRDLLKDYNHDTGDSYYRAVLQNLFFATLNTEIQKRGFSPQTNAKHRDFSLYRYEDQMRDPDTLLALFALTPFINGGLFDCLDSFKAKGDGGYRIDCFSDKHYKRLSIPNRLFFDNTRGLIPLLTHYKFTVEENTPIEQEVALDPELLGKVFENLLAAYNPETGATAKKQTGSYYTPRAIVDYMVEEALVATLAQRVLPTDGDAKFWDERLRYLFDYAKVFDNASAWFDNRETDEVMRTISELKILDPAVGSGAFPMGVLHKLTLALRRLDPDNSRWEQLQRDRAGERAQAAFTISNQQERDVELAEISDTFERYRDSDFGRKLYLIQNGIFGVDIQPVACQIAKLRFFISLTIEQEPNKDTDNFGIKPLPNLETRFVTANTLIGLQLSEARSLLQDDAVQQLLKEIEVIREKHVLANNRGQKLRLEAQEEDLHKRLEEELEIQRRKWVESQQREIEQKAARLPKPEHRKKWREEEQKKYRWRKKKFDSDFEYARKIISWKPYDQNASADFFDPEWMFGVREGFDVVMANPPYVLGRETFGDKMKKYLSENYGAYGGKYDLYIYFTEKGISLLKKNGLLAYILPNTLLANVNAQNVRRIVLENTSIKIIRTFDSKVFAAQVESIVIIVKKDGNNESNQVLIKGEDDCHIPQSFFTENAEFRFNLNIDPPTANLIKKINNVSVSLGSISDICIGIQLGGGSASASKKNFISSIKKDETYKQVLDGKDINSYQTSWKGLYVRYGSWLHRKRNEKYFLNPKIIIRQIGSTPIATYDGEQFYTLNTVYNLIGSDDRYSLKYVLGIINSKLGKWFWIKNNSDFKTLFPKIKKSQIETVPIYDLDLANSDDRGKYDRIVAHVNQILSIKQAAPNIGVSELENEIDQIVYSLYDLTPEEIAIVEEAENV